MPAKLPSIVWDTCVILDALQRTPGRFERIEPFIRAAEKRQIKIVVSEITVAEVTHLPKLNNGTATVDEQEDAICRWFCNEFIVRRTVHPGISERARQVRRECPQVKRVGDTVFLATALFEGLPMVHTFDENLLALDGKIGNPGLKIREPDIYDGTMFAAPQTQTGPQTGTP